MARKLLAINGIPKWAAFSRSPGGRTSAAGPYHSRYMARLLLRMNAI